MGNLNHDPAQGMFFDVFVEVPSVGLSGYLAFSKVSGLSEETEAAEYRTGMDPPVKRQIPGLTSFGDVTFEDGLDREDVIRQWRNLIVPKSRFDDGRINRFHTQAGKSPKGRVTVTLVGPDSSVLHEFKLYNAWPASVEYGDMDASSSDVIIRSTMFKHEGLLEKSGEDADWAGRAYNAPTT